MKLATASTLSLALGAAAYFPGPAQQPLSGSSSEQLPSFLSQATDRVKATLGSLKVPAEAAASWSEVAKDYPDQAVSALQGMVSKSKPKDGVKKRPDSHWDHIVDGKTVMSALADKVDGHEKLENTKLRIKKPNSLGVDEDVKQYSGYLDVDDDKHFFFCTSIYLSLSRLQSLTLS
jgi:cathepsin A (carboxypeptidase C)